MWIDHSLRAWVVAHRIGVVTPVMWSVSVAGRAGIVWLVLGAVLTVMRRMRPSGFVELALSIVLASALTNHVFKPVVGRARPYVSAPSPAIIGGRPDDASFPSGHATNAFAGITVMSRAAPRARFLWWSLAVLIAYSRVYLGVHYPLDVIGGAVVGWLSAAAIIRVFT
jgi:undecaprenyl-diphosphatase